MSVHHNTQSSQYGCSQHRVLTRPITRSTSRPHPSTTLLALSLCFKHSLNNKSGFFVHIMTHTLSHNPTQPSVSQKRPTKKIVQWFGIMWSKRQHVVKTKEFQKKSPGRSVVSFPRSEIGTTPQDSRGTFDIDGKLTLRRPSCSVSPQTDPQPLSSGVRSGGGRRVVARTSDTVSVGLHIPAASASQWSPPYPSWSSYCLRKQSPAGKKSQHRS